MEFDKFYIQQLVRILMEIIKKSLMQWGESMQLTKENCSLFYSPVLKYCRVNKRIGKDAR